MRSIYLSFIIIFSIVVTAHAQIDDRNKSFAIPAVESKVDSLDAPKITPSTPIEADNTTVFGNINTPDLSSDFNKPKNTFSLYGENFGNPGELYTKQIDKHIADIKLTPEQVEQLNGSLTDQFLGDFKSNADSVNIVYRDHGAVDGDLIQVLVNDDVVQARVFLSGGYSGFKLDLQKGINKIDFLALNQGQSGPNTAEFRVVDDNGMLVSENRWNLATGVKATIVVVKE
ncbi:MAG: hypothetical protein ACK5NB_01260 [Flavobacteriaceae bacterium]